MHSIHESSEPNPQIQQKQLYKQIQIAKVNKTNIAAKSESIK
jgi:hypothetical protein